MMDEYFLVIKVDESIESKELFEATRVERELGVSK